MRPRALSIRISGLYPPGKQCIARTNATAASPPKNATAANNLQLSQHVALCLGAFALSLFVAYSALKLYDLPVRAWLGKLGKR